MEKRDEDELKKWEERIDSIPGVLPYLAVIVVVGVLVFLML